jgi:hypothetical protein
MGARAGSTWNGGGAERSISKRYVDFYRWVSTTVENLTAFELYNVVHFVSVLLS